MQRMRGSMTDMVTAAQEAGEISAERPPEVVTGMLMTFMAGIAATLKGPIDKPQAHQLLDCQLEAIV